jgi:CRP-like cAMP-binding protein
MVPSAVISAADIEQEREDDPLLYLPCSTIVKHDRADVIYSAEHLCTHMFVVIAGLVQISRTVLDGGHVIIDLYRADDFFGEGAFVRLPCRGEQALALEKTMVMSWTASHVEEIMDRKPGLALALTKVMAHRRRALIDRIVSLSRDSIPMRLARALLCFSQRFGTPAERGTVCMPAFTHKFLSEYIGTSRELVNTTMAEFRRLELITYSRHEIILRSVAFDGWIRSKCDT